MMIGQLAKHLGVKSDTLRFYEKNGLLAPSNRSASGYRSYTDGDRQRAEFILRCKNVGFTLTEIKALLAIRVDKSHHSCEDVKSHIIAKRLEIQHRIQELEYFNHSLEKLEHACCGGPESAEFCSILDTLEHDHVN